MLTKYTYFIMKLNKTVILKVHKIEHSVISLLIQCTYIHVPLHKEMNRL